VPRPWVPRPWSSNMPESGARKRFVICPLR
jgi:hypothetical protein